jgi:hypothetical protein
MIFELAKKVHDSIYPDYSFKPKKKVYFSRQSNDFIDSILYA